MGAGSGSFARSLGKVSEYRRMADESVTKYRRKMVFPVIRFLARIGNGAWSKAAATRATKTTAVNVAPVVRRGGGDCGGGSGGGNEGGRGGGGDARLAQSAVRAFGWEDFRCKDVLDGNVPDVEKNGCMKHTVLVLDIGE